MSEELAEDQQEPVQVSVARVELPAFASANDNRLAEMRTRHAQEKAKRRRAERELGHLQRQSLELMKQLVVDRQRTNDAGERRGGQTTVEARELPKNAREAIAMSQVQLPAHMADLEVQELNDATLDSLFARWMEARTEPIRERLAEHGDIAVHVGQRAREAEFDASREALETSEKILGVEISLRRHAEDVAEQLQRELERVSEEHAREAAAARQAVKQLDRKEAQLGLTEQELREARIETEQVRRQVKQEERARRELERLCESARSALSSNESFVTELQAELTAVRRESRGRADQLEVEAIARESLEAELRTTRVEYEAARVRLREAIRTAQELESWSHDMQRSHTDKVAAVAAADEVIRETRLEQERLKTTVREAEDARREALRQVEASRLAYEAKLIISTQLEHAFETERASLAEVRARLTASEAGRSSAEGERDTFQREAGGHRSRVEELERALEKADQEARELVKRAGAAERERDQAKAERDEVEAANAALAVVLGMAPTPATKAPSPPDESAAAQPPAATSEGQRAGDPPAAAKRWPWARK